MKLGETPSQPKNSMLLLSISLGIGVTVFILFIGFYRNMFDGNFSDESEIWGHFGDYFNVAISAVNLIIVTLLTWGIFDYQARNDRWKEFESKETYEMQKLVYLDGLVTRSILFAHKTVENLRTLSKKIIENPEEIPVLKAASSVAIDRIVKKINQEEFFQPYLNRINTDGSLEIFEAMDVIYENYNDQLKDLEMMVQNNFLRRDRLVMLTREIIDELAELQKIEKKNGRRGSALFNFLNQIILDYYKGVDENPNNIFQFQNIVFNPVLKYMYDEEKYLDDQFNKLISLTTTANKSIIPIVGNNVSFSERSLVIAENIESIIASVEGHTDLLHKVVIDKKA